MRSFASEYFDNLRPPQKGAPTWEPDQVTLDQATFDRCVFNGCVLPPVSSPERMHTVKRSTLTQCRATLCTLATLALEDVTINNLKIEGGGRSNMQIVWGEVFRHVTLKGHIGTMKNKFGDRSEKIH